MTDHMRPFKAGDILWFPALSECILAAHDEVEDNGPRIYPAGWPPIMGGIRADQLVFIERASSCERLAVLEFATIAHSNGSQGHYAKTQRELDKTPWFGKAARDIVVESVCMRTALATKRMSAEPGETD
jgi:hypothetical protein